MSATAKTKISDPLVLFCAYALLFLPAIDGFAGLAFQFGRSIELNSVIGRQAAEHTTEGSKKQLEGGEWVPIKIYSNLKLGLRSQVHT